MINEGYDLINILELEKREIDYKYDRLIYDIDNLQNKNLDLQEELEYLTDKIDKAIELLRSEYYINEEEHNDRIIDEVLEMLGDKENEHN